MPTIPQDVIHLINKRAEKVGGVSITSEIRMSGSARAMIPRGGIRGYIYTRSSGGERYHNLNSRAARTIGTNLR